MMYTPGSEVVPRMVGTFTFGWSSFPGANLLTAPTSAAWESAARAVYYPFSVPATCTVRRVWWANGATTTGGATVEVGVYADVGHKPGIKLISGAATQGTASEVQFVDVTDTVLGCGVYWLAIMMSSVTNTTAFRALGSGSVDVAYRFEEASADPLPATATPVESSAGAIYLFGFATTASP